MIATAEDARNLTTKRTHEKMQVTSQRIKELALEDVLDKYFKKIGESAKNGNYSLTLIACNSMRQAENCFFCDKSYKEFLKGKLIKPSEIKKANTEYNYYKVPLKVVEAELKARGFNFKTYLFGFIQIISWKDQKTKK